MRETRQMRRFGASIFGAAVLAASVVHCSAPSPEGSGSAEDEASDLASDQAALAAIPLLPFKNVCDEPTVPGYARCHARIRTNASGVSALAAKPYGLAPADLQAAYQIPKGATGTVAVVNAYDDPNAESDLAVYRSQFGLPPCTTANGCFRKVNQNGATSPLPTADSGWAGEISLDLDMVSAACPTCKIILVEANSPSGSELGKAVNTAASLGANAISNSYGGNESSGANNQDAQYYNHPGIAITASSGDSGYGVEYPASGKYVISVGGTSLTKSSSSRGWAEGAWKSGGSGCSKYVSKPGYQTDTGCGNRMSVDISAIGDPNTGVAVYDSYGSSSSSGWGVYGGTSASSPIVAAILVATGKASAGTGAAYLYAHPSAFNDVVSGSNGTCSGSAAYFCNAASGYDGPTGLGTPIGSALGSVAVDAGAPLDAAKDTGAPDSGGGTPVDAGKDSGSTAIDAGKDSGGGTPPPVDSGTGPVDAGPPDTGTGSVSGSCSHDLCSKGTRQTKTCSTCAGQVCARDSYCCNFSWDATCVREVGTLCGAACN